ncbi:VanZ family protein [Anoxybacillus sp. TBDG-1]
MRIYFQGSLFVIFFAIGVVFIWIKFRKEHIRFFFLSSFFLYVCLLIKYTQFPITLFLGDSFEQNIDEIINVVPFINLDRSPINYILNIFMTVPFGFIFPFIKKVNSKEKILWSILVPIVIEGLQLLQFILTSYSERIVDINDILMNTFGIWIGYYLYRILVLLVENYSRINKDIKRSSLVNFIIHHNER